MIRRIARDSPEAAAALPLELCAPVAKLADALAEARREQALRERLKPQLARALAALVGAELALRPEQIASLVDRELARVRWAREIELQVHPEDAALLQDEERLRSQLEIGGALRVVHNAQLTRGGCVLITSSGQIDATLETRVALTLEQLTHGAFDEP